MGSLMAAAGGDGKIFTYIYQIENLLLKIPQLLQIRKGPPPKLLYFFVFVFYCGIVVFKMLFRKMVPYGQYWFIGITSPQYYFVSVLKTKI